MTQKRPVPEYKKKIVNDLMNLIKSKKTIMITSIKNIPASQFQAIGKKLREKAVIKVPKKNLIFKAIDSSGSEAVKKLKEHVGDSSAILFSELDAFELAGELVKNTSPAKAKAGQEAPFDIEIEAGPTNLTPGPAISELGALGIEIQIEKGKINIKSSKVIVQKGKKISQNAAEVMNKLDIKPFSVGFIPLAAFDTAEEKLYLDIKIDREKTLEKLKDAYKKALGFAVAVGYVSESTIKFLINKAYTHGKAIENLQGAKQKSESSGEEVKNGE
ncbi:MAG: 50S ribosomal protein L10 [archaeon]